MRLGIAMLGSIDLSGVGDAFGLAVGETDRVGEGMGVGSGVGTSVGATVGVGLGLGVGDAVGLGVGSLVGDGVGVPVGLGVLVAHGVLVGFGVSVSVSISGVVCAAYNTLLPDRCSKAEPAYTKTKLNITKRMSFFFIPISQ